MEWKQKAELVKNNVSSEYKDLILYLNESAQTDVSAIESTTKPN